MSLALNGCGDDRVRDRTPTADASVAADAALGAEPCNGRDDNADGQVDEHCTCNEGATQPCYGGRWPLAGVGACVRGTQRCERRVGDQEFGAWRWGACEGWADPQAQEACGDALDNDCDGTVNEDCGCALGERAACYPGPADTAGVGVCASGNRACTAGTGGQDTVWGACTGAVTPAPTDTCGDDLDNDCDGTVNERCTCRLTASEACYPGPAETADVGVCKSGSRTCLPGPGGEGSDWGACEGAVTPAATDTCDDGRDNNCDGTVDDGCGAQVSSPDICDVGAPHTYVEAAVDPSAPATWYVLDFEGRVSKTTDSGATFTVLCHVPPRVFNFSHGPVAWVLRGEARLLVSPASDHTAYLALSARVLRIDALGPAAECPTIRQPPNWPAQGTFAGSPFAIAPRTGDLLSWSAEGSPPGQLHRSSDRGQSWSAVATTITSDAFIGALAVDPADEHHLLAVSVAGSPNGGIYESTDGTTWTRRSAVNLSGATPMVRFDPTRPGKAYVSVGTPIWLDLRDGLVTTDGGAHWTRSAPHGMRGEWALNSTNGAGFRFRAASGSGIVLERAPDLSQPSWTSAHDFPTDFDSWARVDAAGPTVLAIVGLRLWVSSDSGQTFAGPLGGGKPVVLDLSSIDSVDSSTIYATSPEWDVYRSTDQGATFSRVHTNTEPRNRWRAGDGLIRVNPARPQNAIVTIREGFDPPMLQTTDAFQTTTFRAGGSHRSRSILALSATDPNIAFLLGPTSSVSTDAGTSWSEIAVLPGGFSTSWAPTAAWVLPGGPLRVLVTTALSVYAPATEVYLYDHATKTQSDYGTGLRTALGNTRPADMESFKIGASTVIRVIGGTGRLAQSTDGGATFAALPGATGGLDDCGGARRLASLATNRDVLATWCSRAIHYSKDGGLRWEQIRGPAWSDLACWPTQVIVTEHHLVATCQPDAAFTSTDTILVRLSY